MSLNGTNGSKPTVDDLNHHGQKIQELIARIDSLADPKAGALLQECMETVLAFYGEGLARILEVVRGAGPDGERICDALGRDAVVRGFLLIHGLHPLSLEARLHEALDKVRPYLKSHGGNVELIRLRDDVAQLRLIGHCETCPSSAVTLELALRQAIEEACPDLAGFEVEGVEMPAPDRAPPAGSVPRDWMVIEGAGELPAGGLMPVQTPGPALVICKADRDLYAYRDRCPACNLPLHLGTLCDGLLSCRAGHRYNVRQAGRSVDGAGLHLDPFPLLVEGGVARVALQAEGGPRAAPLGSAVS
ncbi:MAG: NifU family protein [Verrucomicrobia bacterium]|nr:NifU family protein [Verrucomicrobiota bacterium]